MDPPPAPTILLPIYRMDMLEDLLQTIKLFKYQQKLNKFMKISQEGAIKKFCLLKGYGV